MKISDIALIIEVNEDDLRPDEGLDLVFHHTPIGIQRAFADGEDHIFVQPFVEPFAQRHARVLGQIHIAIGFDGRVQELQGLLLRFGED